MRITFRIVLSVILVVSAIAFLLTLWQVQQEKEGLRRDLDRRTSLLAESLQETIEPLVEQSQAARIQQIVETFGNRERLAGVAVYDAKDQLIAITPALAPELPTTPSLVLDAMNADRGTGGFVEIGNTRMYLYALPLHREAVVTGALVILYDATYLQDHLFRIWKNNFVGFLVQALLISLTTLFVIRWSIVGSIAKMADWMKRLRTDTTAEPLHFPDGDIFEPLTREVAQMARSVLAARASAEEEARLRQAGESVWTPARLKEHLRTLLSEKSLYVISNREPYVHVRKGTQIECVVPPSGLVTALEPVLKVCGGMWIAHGSGDADREVADNQGKLRVPIEEPQYVLKRVWLTKEEEKGYYYGFSNEGLWPLCHIAHTRPIFRMDDWGHYQTVNEKFAEATLVELEGVEEPLVLIQDYHFALLPRLIKEKRPDARIGLFWHTPWPNPESFSICPWQRELLHGMLGADLIGFHLQFHCNNFLDTVDRTLESRIDWEHFAVRRGRRRTYVKPFPISIAFPDPAAPGLTRQVPRISKETLLETLGVKARYLGVGVDRLDYTKGIVERLRAIERFLEKYPRYQGQFTYVELGAPSRTYITHYHELIAEVEAESERINWRFHTEDWKPIILLKKHHSHEEIAPFYAAADVCLVTSLHDGMNLVAKEYVGAREDERGVLILSRFTGASRELRDALIVNPYNIDEMAEAIRSAIEMPVDEQKVHMQRMRDMLKKHNIYRWAANLMTELAQIRIERGSIAQS
ncbi:MAG: trehalose-6-phosphate synthase [Candidatus Methylomirabilales bacterium]